MLWWIGTNFIDTNCIDKVTHNLISTGRVGSNMATADLPQIAAAGVNGTCLFCREDAKDMQQQLLRYVASPSEMLKFIVYEY